MTQVPELPASFVLHNCVCRVRAKCGHEGCDCASSSSKLTKLLVMNFAFLKRGASSDLHLAAAQVRAHELHDAAKGLRVSHSASVAKLLQLGKRG